MVGCLVLQIGGADLAIATGAGLESIGSMTGRRLQLFPPTTPGRWPPKEVLNDGTFVDATTESSIIDRRIPITPVPGLHGLPGHYNEDDRVEPDLR